MFTPLFCRLLLACRCVAAHFKRSGKKFFICLGLVFTGQHVQAHETPSSDESLAPQGPKVQEYVQSWLGTVDTDSAWSMQDPVAQTELSGDMSSLPLVGGVGQRLWGDRLQYGFEGGGLVGWKNDSVKFAATNGASLIRVDNSLLLFEPFMGGVIALRPAKWLRLYVAAGPSIAWAFLDDIEDDDIEAEDGNGTTIVGSGNGTFFVLEDGQNDFSFSVYARAGLDFEFRNGFSVGVSARYVDHEFDFKSRGDLTLDEVQWFLTLGQQL